MFKVYPMKPESLAIAEKRFEACVIHLFIAKSKKQLLSVITYFIIFTTDKRSEEIIVLNMQIQHFVLLSFNISKIKLYTVIFVLYKDVYE